LTAPLRRPSPRVLVVAGMHRSGTSVLASLLHRSGCPMGEQMLPADAQNRPGYFEDLEFLDLNRRMLAAAVPVNEPGHPDWGWTEGVERSGVDTRVLDGFVDEADALVAARHSQARKDTAAGRRAAECWGWKDPRTTVLLDFWDARIPDAQYLFIYRPPWDVADSMQRIEAAEFLRHPGFAYRIWHYYNRAALAFAQANHDRALIVSAAAVIRDPRALLELVESRFAIRLERDPCVDVADPALMMSADTRLAMLGAATDPECVQLLRELEATADLPSGQALPALLAVPSAADDALVSVIIPCFNDGVFLLEAIASVENSVSMPYELIVVNDGSTDAQTLRILAGLRQAGYRIIDQENRGLAEARNRGVREARCRHYVPLDADNRLRPAFVEAAVAILEGDPAVAAVYGDRREFGLRSGRVAVGVPDLDRLLCGNYIDACAVIRRDAWLACGGYDGEMPIQGMEDWEFWLSVFEHGFTLHRLDMETFDYRVRPDSLLTTTLSPQARASTERYVLAKHAPFYLQHLRRQVDRLESVPVSEAEPTTAMA
jgi:hypothetical protein